MQRNAVSIAFDNSYARLPGRFYAARDPTPVSGPRLIRLNVELADWLGLDAEQLRGATGVAMLAGNEIPYGSKPIAQAYAGHQFGNFVPQLGDGRAVLLGEVIARDGSRRDLQLKGSGRTVFSRGGDGRAALGPVLREYVLSEAMHALGVPTTRALAAVLTGEPVVRESVLPGAVLTRVAASHVRVGTFEFFAAQGDVAALRTLAEYVIARHYPELAAAERPFLALLRAVIGRQASLVARWLSIGFIHGVMNTDNTSVSGETIDYGPCAFMDGYDPGAVFSAIDRMGRYAYANQPRIAQWNLARFAEALLPLLADDEPAGIAAAERTLGEFPALFETAYLAAMRPKLGLATEQPGDRALIQDLLASMAEAQTDFTLTFRRLADAAEGAGAVFAGPGIGTGWEVRWRDRLAGEPETVPVRAAAMRAVNPLYIPRNHLVEAVIAAGLAGDFAPFESLLQVLATPYSVQPGRERFALPPRDDERVLQTFCGT